MDRDVIRVDKSIDEHPFALDNGSFTTMALQQWVLIRSLRKFIK
jgi:hypothetical protein